MVRISTIAGLGFFSYLSTQSLTTWGICLPLPLITSAKISQLTWSQPVKCITHSNRGIHSWKHSLDGSKTRKKAPCCDKPCGPNSTIDIHIQPNKQIDPKKKHNVINLWIGTPYCSRYVADRSKQTVLKPLYYALITWRRTARCAGKPSDIWKHEEV